MRIRELLWDDETAEHLAQHGVHPQEAEEVCGLRPFALRARLGRYIVLGQSNRGRYLTVIIAPLGHGRATLITARDMTGAERRRYANR